VAVFLGGLLSSVPIALTVLNKNRAGWLTRHVVAVAQMLWSALFVHLTGGRIETHFMCSARWRSWRSTVTGRCAEPPPSPLPPNISCVELMWPRRSTAYTNPEWWRFLEHAFWVVFCVSFLISSCLSSVKEMRHISEREAQFESAARRGDGRRVCAMGLFDKISAKPARALIRWWCRRVRAHRTITREQFVGLPCATACG